MSTINDIKAEFRAAMNGVAARAIRESGMNYRLAYGIELPRLRQIAADFEPDHRLARELWQEDVRESRMIAILLQPSDSFYPELADLWVESLVPEQAEIAQLLATELLPRTPYAAEKAFLWIASEGPMYQLCGFATLARLFMQGERLSPDAENEFLDQAGATLPSAFLALRKAVANALLHYAENVPEAQPRVDAILGV